MKAFRIKGISKRYAARCALYRRLARGMGGHGDFSEASMREMYAWESTGRGGVDKQINGFAYGKWVRDVTVAMWREDIENGDFTKYEFLRTAIGRIHNTKTIAGFCVPEDGFVMQVNRDSR
jgi:hypothetical protein